MLTIHGPKTRFCDGVSRRSFLQIGALGMAGAGLNLADIFRSEARAQSTSKHKAVINIFLGGGPPHQDMWEIKTEAPVDIKGEFKPIATNVPGIQIGECFPRIARMMDKCVVIRSVVGATGGHDGFQCTTGWRQQDMAAMGGRPSIGAVAAKVQGSVDPSVPPFVGLAARTTHVPWSDSGRPGFLGPAYRAFTPDGDGMANLKLRNISTAQFDDRKKLMKSFDSLRRELDATGARRHGRYRTRLGAHSSRLLEALDISKESGKLRDRYGDGKPYQFQYDGALTVNDQRVMGRRLVEAGVRCVTLSYGRWDSHGKTFDLVRDHGAKLDQCFTALVEDLEARGMLNDVTVIAWGEFGRTPKINNGAGRDHWPQVSCALMAGGGMRTGQAIGATNRLGEVAAKRPVTFQEIFATLYHNMGLNPATTTINDTTGRPQYPIEGEPIREAI